MPTEKESRFLLIAIVFAILFGVWFFSIKDVFPPFILSLIITAFLLPFREHKSVRVLIALVLAVLLIWMFYYLQDIVTPFLISFALAYLFDPIVDWFEKRRVTRTASIIAIVTLILGGLFLVGLLIIPQFAEEVQILATSLPSYEEFKSRLRLGEWAFLSKIGLDVERLVQVIETEASQKINELIKYFSESALGITSGLSSLITQLINLILIPFLTFYFLRDFDKNIASLRKKVPDRHQERADKIYNRVNTILSLYIRGKILAAMLITLITWLALSILQINFALLIGLTTGFLSLIPYVGPIITFIIGGVLGFLNPDPEKAILEILIVIGVIQVLDMAIISPKMVGEKLGLHPVLSIFALFVFAKVLGVVGLLMALPLTAIVKVFVMDWYDQSFFKQEFFRDDVPS